MLSYLGEIILVPRLRFSLGMIFNKIENIAYKIPHMERGNRGIID